MYNRYRFPKTAECTRIIHKNKIYEQSKASRRVQDMFARQIEKIVWEYKLAPDTLNIKSSEYPREIQVLRLELRQADCKGEILQTIDKTIPSPIVFELHHLDRMRYAACYKRSSASVPHKAVVGTTYLQSEWIAENTPSIDLPPALDMAGLYRALLAGIAPLPVRPGEALQELVERVGEWQSKRAQAKKLEKRIHKEQQFNRRYDLNQELNALRKEIQQLQG